jgi:hypothetical protein
MVVAAVVAASGEGATDRPLPITAAAIRRHTVVLGSDAMTGRAPGTPGAERAADFIVGELAAAGVAPFGDGGRYEQRVPLHGSLAEGGSELTIWTLGRERRLRLGDEYLLATAGSQTLIAARAPMVFVGHGIVAPEFDHNDYQGVDVRGKVVVFLPGEPASDDPRRFGGAAPTVYASAETKAKIALTRGAVGSLIVPRPQAGLDEAWQRSGRDYAFESLSLATSLPEHLVALLHPEIAEWLFADALYDLGTVLEMESRGTLRSFYLPGELSFRGRFCERDVVAANIVGRVDGRQAELAASSVVVLAHYDHLGIGPAVAGDPIYNGVVDNALGVSCVLEIARTLAARPVRPGRPVIVLFTTAEEAGLLGARTFLAHSPLPPARLAAAINVDGLAFLGPFANLHAIGGELSDLGRRLASAVRPLGLVVSSPPDAVWDHAAYARGDQLAFAEAGVPSVLVTEGFDWPGRSEDEAIGIALGWMAERYHSPQDDLDQPIDWEAAALHCNAVLNLVLETADNPAPPKWHPYSPYAYERQLSIALDR